jgi:hypothetical protein
MELPVSKIVYPNPEKQEVYAQRYEKFKYWYEHSI